MTSRKGVRIKPQAGVGTVHKANLIEEARPVRPIERGLCHFVRNFSRVDKITFCQLQCIVNK